MATVQIAWVNGRALRDVTCERCSERFGYVVERRGIGAGDALFMPSEAGRSAREDLDRKLAAAVDPVACPGCGWYQEDMVRAARTARGKWLRRAGRVAIALGCVLGGIALIYELAASLPWYGSASAFVWDMAFAALAAGGFALYARHLRCSTWSPNEDTLWRRRNQPKEAERIVGAVDYARLAASAKSEPGSATSPSPPGTGGSPDRA